MAVESIGAAPTQNTTNNQNTALGQEDLFKILLTELSFQDPLKPMDNKEFIAQLAQFTNLEQSRQFNKNLETLLSVQSANQSISLLNKTVEIDTGAAPEVGTVISVIFDQGSPILSIRKVDGTFISDIRLSQIRSVR